MRTEFYEIYRDVYDFYRRFPGVFFPAYRDFPGVRLEETRRIRKVTDAIEAAISKLELTDRIRPDARHFLLVNLDQMVFIPLSHPSVRSEVDIIEKEELQEDIMMILAHAQEISEEQEVTGRAVVTALSRVWKELRINRIQIWG